MDVSYMLDTNIGIYIRRNNPESGARQVITQLRNQLS